MSVIGRAVAAFALVAAALAGVGATATSPPPIALHWLQMIDSSRGYALSGDDGDAYRLLYTSDGGLRWRDATPRGGTWRPLGPLSVLGETRLFSRRLGPHTFAVVRSLDGGRTWDESQPFEDPRGDGAGQPFALDAAHFFVAVDEGAAAGSQGEALYTSSDGARRWRLVSRTSWGHPSRSSLPTACDKNGFSFATPRRGWAGGYCAGGPAFFYRTVDGGRTWHRQLLPVPAQCACDTSAPLFFSTSVGAVYVIGFPSDRTNAAPIARVFWTGDGGRHWRPGTPPQLGRVAQVSFADARSVWITEHEHARPSSPVDILLRTRDAGAHWQSTKLAFNADGYRFDALSAVTAYGIRPDLSSNTLIVTHDGGRTWQTIRATYGRA
jgi:photosystem II stability/assembly factor-like uncharacterized protein